MKRITPSLAVLVAVLLCPFSPASATTLQEALEATYKTNPTLQAQRYRLMAVDEQAAQAFAGWMPSVTAEYDYGREKRESTGARHGVFSNTDSRRLSVTQPIFNGGATVASMHQANNRIKAARADLVSTEQDVLFDAVTSYMNVLRDQELLQLSINNEEVLKKHLSVTDERFRLGEVTRTDTAQAQARLSTAISERIEAEGNLASSIAQYKDVAGEVISATAMPDTPTDLPATLEELQQQALVSHPRIVAATYNAAAAKDSVKVRVADILPDVTLRGDMQRDDGTFSAGAGNELKRESVTVNVRVPLFQSGAEYSRVREARQEAQRANSLIQDTRTDVEEFSTQVWEQFQVARSTIASTQDAADAAQVALEGVIQEAQVGSRTTLDVLDAEQELFRAKSEVVRAKRDEIVAAYRMKSATAQLTAASLGLDVAVYNPKENYQDVKYQMIGF